MSAMNKMLEGLLKDALGENAKFLEPENIERLGNNFTAFIKEMREGLAEVRAVQQEILTIVRGNVQPSWGERMSLGEGFIVEEPSQEPLDVMIAASMKGNPEHVGSNDYNG